MYEPEELVYVNQGMLRQSGSLRMSNADLRGVVAPSPASELYGPERADSSKTVYRDARDWSAVVVNFSQPHQDSVSLRTLKAALETLRDVYWGRGRSLLGPGRTLWLSLVSTFRIL